MGALWSVRKRYKVDYCGRKSFYARARDSYLPGKKMTLRYELIATDTDCTFLLDAQPLQVRYDGAYIISFVMPAHDVTLCCREENSMKYNG